MPDRFRFGYGLTPGLVEEARARQPTLIVTVDNGVSSIEGVAAARALGYDVLITDHHLPGRAVAGGYRDGEPQRSRQRVWQPRAGRCGRGVLRTRCAVRGCCRSRALLPAGARPVTQWLDLVALGTVADLVPLDANNRVLVAQGIRRMRAGQCTPGLAALLKVAGRDQAGVTAADLGFAVGPRLECRRTARRHEHRHPLSAGGQ